MLTGRDVEESVTTTQSTPRRLMAGSGKTTGTLAAVAAVLVIALGAVLAYLIVTNRDNPPTAPVTATVMETSTPPPTATTTETQYVVPETPAGSAVVEGGHCLETEARSFGTDPNGQSLVCTYMGAGGGYVWVQHATNSGEIHNIGEPCDPAVDSVAQDPSGKAIMCGGQTWVGGP
ncbi:MAG: hypothetical protein WAW85_05575 [Gordonia sp. (in: high G+C Gram-positive bacteria)]|uniref:hypothetical protein n=1 Tax=Gordonia sp. (in: high G+C Gram-positive bacteria) TaxID=84139 RepID=UPI003BB691B4